MFKGTENSNLFSNLPLVGEPMRSPEARSPSSGEGKEPASRPPQGAF